MLKIEVTRGVSGSFGTNGSMSVMLGDTELYHCFTLEDPHHEKKVWGDTCIPEGEYNVSLTFSTRFKKILPLLHDVPEFAGVRIHGGNNKAHTHGCILVGEHSDGAGNVNTCAPSVEAIIDLISAYGGTARILIK